MGFDKVIGQEEAKQRLKEMVKEARLPHALMLCGPEECGKMALALAFASYLLCKNRTEKDDACGQCRQCAMLKEWHHPDLHFTYPVIRPAGTSSDHQMVSDDFAEEWHKMLSAGVYFDLEMWLGYLKAENKQPQIYVGESDDLMHKLSIKSNQGGYKISLIWLPERMNPECANKLLKLLEEPPSQTVFIMVCEEPEKLLDTIISRTQRIDIRRIDTNDIQQALISQRGISDEAAKHIARVANGSWLKALKMLEEDNDSSYYLSLFMELMRKAYSRKIKDLKKWSETVAGLERERQMHFLDFCQRMIRENFIMNFNRPELNYMTEEEESFSKNFSRFINEYNVIEISEAFSRAQREIGQNANGKILYFDFTMTIIMLLIKGNNPKRK